jgi:glutamine amidotransferase
MKHVILDYDVGNLDSVIKGFERVGISVELSKDLEVIKEATSLILPGVGAFKESMIALEKSGLIPAIKAHVESGKYLLGICLGMQLLYEESYEFGVYKGLGIIEGSIRKITSDVKIPHMGWNNLIFHKKDPILKYIKEDDFVYFVHSYYVDSTNRELLAYTNYGIDIPAIIRQGNVYATQFHPEKSGTVGLNILKAYGEMINETIPSN